MDVAAGIPTLGLFSKTCPSSWTPPDSDLHATVRAEPEQDKEGKEVFDMKNLSVERVIGAAEHLLKGGNPKSQAPSSK